MPALLPIVVALAFACWVVALCAAIVMLRHRLPDRSLGWFLANGWAFFSRHPFTPQAAPAQRLFIAAALLFLICLLTLLVLSLALAPPAGA